MSRTEGVALAFGALVPLWWRQHRFERQVVNQLRIDGQRLHSDLEDVMKDWNRWAKRLTRDIERAFKAEARR